MSQKYVTVIPVWGDMRRGWSPYYNPAEVSLDYVEGRLRAAATDGNCVAIVQHFRSGGGEQFGAPELGRLVAQIAKSKPIYAYTDSIMASAAIYVGAASTAIYCSPSSLLGSVGVMREHVDPMRNLQNEGIDYSVIRAGVHKGRELPGQMTPEYKAHLQGMTDAMHADFKTWIMAHRKVDNAHLEGQIFSGAQAVAIGLADGLVDSITDLLSLITIPQETTNVPQ